MTNFVFVRGTSGKLDYLVLATVGRCVAAVKPEVVAHKQYPIGGIGVRVRVCASPTADFSKESLTAQEIQAGAPHIKFHQINAVRGSVSFFMQVKGKSHADLAQGIQERINNKTFALNISKITKSALKMPVEHSDKAIADFLAEGWARDAVKLSLSASKTDPEQVEQAVLGWLKNIGKPKTGDENA